jgi:hypothetical protein
MGGGVESMIYPEIGGSVNLMNYSVSTSEGKVLLEDENKARWRRNGDRGECIRCK